MGDLTLPCRVGTASGTFDLAPLGTFRIDPTLEGGSAAGAPPRLLAEAPPWSYLISACGDVAVPRLWCFEAWPPPTPFLQVTEWGVCHSLGQLSQRSAVLGEGGGARTPSVTLRFEGGDGCGAVTRAASLQVLCADAAAPSNVSVREVSACNYVARVHARAGCPLECARDPRSGAVCGGTGRGGCEVLPPAQTAQCVCAAGFAGPHCAPRAGEEVSATPRPTPLSALCWLGAALGAFLCIARLCRARTPRQQQCAPPPPAGVLRLKARDARVAGALLLGGCVGRLLGSPPASLPPAALRAGQWQWPHAKAPMAHPPSRGAPPFDFAAWLAHATFEGPRWAAEAGGYAPWPGASRGAGWREFSPPELLACAARVGGVGFVGDSVMRETVNRLLEMVGGCCVDVSMRASTVWAGHAGQAFSADYPVGNSSVHIAYRFARNAHPDLGELAAQLLGGGKVRALVAGSGFWDLAPVYYGSHDEDVVTRYAQRLALFLRGLRRHVRAGVHRLVWREVTPTAFEKMPLGDNRGFFTLGRTSAINAVARRLLLEGWGGGAGEGGHRLPPWALVDADLLMPAISVANLTEWDGYHPSHEVLVHSVYAIFSELCPPFGPWSESLETMGGM